jgi:hypothetical protein
MTRPAALYDPMGGCLAAAGLHEISSAQPRNSAATSPEQWAHTMATATDSQEAAFSRSTGLPSNMGKATAEIKGKVPECVKEEFTLLAYSLGMNESELLRSLVMVRLYGVEGAEMMHSKQLRAAAGIGPDRALNSSAANK